MKIPDDLKDQLTEYRNIPILQKNRLLHLKGEESIPQPYSFSIQNIQIQAAKWS